MDRSVAQGPGADPRDDLDPRLARRLALLAGVLLALAAAAIYLATRVDRDYDHFVWQAAAFLEGQAAIRYPVAATATSAGNAWFQDVLPVVTADGVPRALLPFPPLPAVVLLPFVAVFGLATDSQTIFTLLAAVDVAICWWAMGRLEIDVVVRLAVTVFFAFGTVFWYTGQLATTWYQAHILAVGLTFLAIGLALHEGSTASAARTRTVRVLALAPRQVAAGLLLGLAATARLPVILGWPFFAFVGPGGSVRRRAWSSAVGAAIPLIALLVYTQLSTGHLISPAYDALYRVETAAYPALGYHADWSIEDLRYIPQNLPIALFGLPSILPSVITDGLGIHATTVCTLPNATRGLFDVACPVAVPRDIGMSVILTSPAYLLAIPVLPRFGRDRIVTGAVLAVVLIAVVDLMHFSQGWVQFGYRFSDDAAPFALVLVALGMARLVERRTWGMRLAMALVVVSIAVNAWGVAWSRLLGW